VTAHLGGKALISYLAGYFFKYLPMKTRTISFIAAVLILTGCAEVMNLVQSASPVPVTEEEVVSGLKEALITGAGNSAQRLAAENGYYGDEAIKILLPPEANTIINNVSKLPGGDKMVQDVILRINRAAEDAAKEAAPVFTSCIKQMTIKDAFNILNGPDNAATTYLRGNTYNELYSLYSPKIKSSTEKKIVGNLSTKESWIALTGKWNILANSVAGKIAGFKPVNTDIDDYLTNKALNGMFLKIELEELKIRKDVSARVSPILKRVFGSLDNKTK
jgi:hypothetical protein